MLEKEKDLHSIGWKNKNHNLLQMVEYFYSDLQTNTQETCGVEFQMLLTEMIEP